MDNRIIAIIPAFNEEKNIKRVVTGVIKYCQLVIIVNDNSTDSTKKIITEMKNTYSEKLEIINNKRNMGIGSSMKKGLVLALSEESDIIIKIDGDGQHRPKDIPEFIRKIEDENLDLVKGNRFYNIDSVSSMPKIKVFGNLLITNIQKIISGNYSISDPNNGFLALKTEKIRLINIKHLHNKYFFENSLSIIFTAFNFKIGEVGIETIYRDEKSSIPVFVAGLKLIPTFILFLIRKNLITASRSLSINSLIFFISIFLTILNLIINSLVLWTIIVCLIPLYIFVDILNHYQFR
jgi:dolichol-phosphate mannosyltransferase